MKQILSILFTLLVFEAFAEDTTIVFQKIPHDELFALAKKENKPVMIYFHFDGCGVCLKMENTTFKDPSVAEFFNKNFISYEINTYKDEGVELRKIYNPQTYPSFFFFNSTGEEIHRLVGYFDAQTFLQRAENAISPENSLSYYTSLYKSGHREKEFLFDYTYKLNDAFELDSLVINDYLNTLTTDEMSEEKNLRYIYEFCLHKHKVCTPYQSKAVNFLISQKEKFYPYFDSEQVDTRIVMILLLTTFGATKDRNEDIFYSALELLKPYDTGHEYVYKEMDGRPTAIISTDYLILESLILFYDKTGNTIEYQKTLEEYINKIWNVAYKLNDFAGTVYLTSDNPIGIQNALKCSKRSIALENNYAYNDTYACLLYKSGQHKKALGQAKKAIKIAKKNNEGYTQTEELIDKINSEKKK